MGEFRAIGATVILCLAMLSGPAGARDKTAFMTVGLSAMPPTGHRQFCRDNPAECLPEATPGSARSVAPGEAPKPAAPKPVFLTTTLILSINAINTAVNATVRPESDKALYGVEEHWTYPTGPGAGAGDCEDFVLLKRRLLREIGIPAGDLLITVVRKLDGEGHAVLTLRATNGDFILDNLDWRIRAFADTPYRYLKRQDPIDPAAWSRIEDGNPAVVSAVNQ